MAKKLRVRFSIKVGDQQSQLVAVTELPSGDLIITQRPNGSIEVANFQGSAILRQRYTVHVSPNSSGHLLNSRLELASGDYLRTASFVNCATGPLIAVLFSRRWPIMRREGFVVPLDPGNTIYQVADYDEERNNLLTHIVVTQLGLGTKICQIYGGSSHSFSKFDVAVIPRFIWFPSSSKGDAVTPTSADLEISGDLGRGRLGEIETLQIEELSRVFLELEDPLLNRLRERISMQVRLEKMPQAIRTATENRLAGLRAYRLPL